MIKKQEIDLYEANNKSMSKMGLMLSVIGVLFFFFLRNLTIFGLSGFLVGTAIGFSGFGVSSKCYKKRNSPLSFIGALLGILPIILVIFGYFFI
jgi:hypothetical protein